MNWNKFIPLLLASLALVILIVALAWSTNEKLTVDEVLYKPENFVGETILVSGKVEKVNCVTTLMECSSENPCCNSVECSLVLKGELGLIQLLNNSKKMQCTGTNCNVSCEVEPGNHTFEGEFISSDGTYALDIEQML